MNIYMLFSLIAVISVYAIALFVYVKGRGKEPNRYFALITFLGGTWCWWPFLLGIAPNDDTALIFARIIYIFALLCPPIFFKFTLVITQNEFTSNKRKYLIISWVLSAFLLLFLPTDHFFSGVKRFLPYFTVQPGLFYNIFIIYFGIIYLYCWKEVIIAHNAASDIKKRNQMKYIFAAFVVALIEGFMHLFSPYFNAEIIPHDVLSVIYFYIFAIAIVRHQLMEIEVIIKKTLVFAGLLASVFAALVLPTLLIQEYIFRSATTGGKIAGLAMSGIIIILTLRRIEDFLRNVTDKFLFQKKYDYKELLRTFTNEVLTVLDLNKLVTLTVAKLSDIIKLQSCGILLFNEDKEEYHLVASQGVKEKDIVLEKENTLTAFLMRSKSYLSVKTHEKEYKLPNEIIEDMNRLKFELAFPLVTLQGDMIGILTLGKKKSDEDYTQDDMDILLPLARTLAIAISNAEMFDELGKTQAEAAQREKMAVIGTLSAGINHEICNPLGIARGQCEAFLLNVRDGLYKDKSQEELFEKSQKIMEKVIHETDRATAITKRLSSFAKPSKGLISDDVSIKDEINEVLALVSYELKLDRIDIIQEIDENLPFISADEKQLQEVFFNLIRNAAQAIEEKGTITITAKKEGGKVIINIEDTGHGIPEDKLKEIFNPFYTTKEPGKGTGLGLFIVRQVVERNRGRISVRSKVGQGTTFALEFPLTRKVAAK